MAQYRKKPIPVDAIQWKPFEMLMQEVLKFMDADNKRMKDRGILSVGKYKGELIIKTLEGEMTVMDGDWIIKGVFGEFYPCKADIFEATYELVSA